MPALSFLSECRIIWCVRSPFSHVWLFVILRTQSARLLCPFSFKHGASCAKPLVYLIVAYNFPIFFSFSITKEIVVVQLLSHDPFVTSFDPMNCSTPGFPVLHHLPSLLKLLSIELVMPSNHLIPCCPLLLRPSVFPSIRIFFMESALCITWPKYWSFSFSIIPSNEDSSLISFRIHWFDLLAGQGTLKSLLQHHSLKASII